MGAQLDLFLDSRSVVLANEAIAALSARDGARASVSLAQLRREALDYASLPALDTLTRALAEWRKPAPEAAAISRAVTWLDNEIAPAAEMGLGAAAQAFLAAFFRDLADAARGLGYDQTCPTAHQAWLYLRCGEFADAEAAALTIPHWNETPDALHWLAVARDRLQGLAAARPLLFALAWHEPGRLASVLAELADELLDRDWRAFERACEWESVEEIKLSAWFPAWYLLEHPAVGEELDGVGFPDSPPATAARLLLHIIELERQANWRTLSAYREQLRRLNPDLFSLYMARRAVQHR